MQTGQRALLNSNSPGTLAARLQERDQERFSGREAELKLLNSCLAEDPPACVVFVHGPAGIGKSTLLREFERRANEGGWESFSIEGRELSPAPDSLEAALGAAQASPRPLVLIDTYERMSGLDGYLRRALLPSLPGSAVIVIAGRHPPDPEWLTGVWKGVATELGLEKLSSSDSVRLLEAHGLQDSRAVSIADWAEGSPLALALAADAANKDPGWKPTADDAGSEVLDTLIRRVVDTELQGERLSALGVSATARVTTPALLGAVLPDSDADAAYERLRALTFTEPLGDGLTLHELVRKTLRADFRHRDPERERELRRRIVDYLYEQAQRGNPLISIELAHLIENPTIKWGFGWEGSIDYRIDIVRPGDADYIGAMLRERNLAEWWTYSQLFFDQAVQRVAVARDRNDNFCGYTISMSPATAPSFAEADPLLGPWLAHARSCAQLGDSVLWHDSIDFTGDPRGRVQAMLGMAGILRSGSPNPRFAYMPINPEMPAAVLFARTLGAEHLEELDVTIGAERIECHRIDYGPGGLIAAQRAVVYLELGLPNPQEEAVGQGAEPEAVRAALRNFRVPSELARSSLAQGDTVDERVESVRQLLRDAAERAFGDTDNEKLLKRVLIRGYLESESSHEQAADDLNLSRAAYFRRLRAAAERVAEYLAGRASTA